MRIIIPALLATTLLAGCGERRPDPRGVDRGEVLLQVSAIGRTDNRPDEARFSAGVSTIEASGPAASRANAEKMNRLVAALKAQGIGNDDIQTRNITVGRIDYGANRGRFEANNVVEVRVRKVDGAGAAIGAATGAGANILSGPELRLSDPEGAKNAAYAAAYKSARARADAYAKAAGLGVSRILAIRDAGEGGGVPYPPPVVTQQANYARVDAAPPIQPGLTTSEVRVAVDFALKPQ